MGWLIHSQRLATSQVNNFIFHSNANDLMKVHHCTKGFFSSNRIYNKFVYARKLGKYWQIWIWINVLCMLKHVEILKVILPRFVLLTQFRLVKVLLNFISRISCCYTVNRNKVYQCVYCFVCWCLGLSVKYVHEVLSLFSRHLCSNVNKSFGN